MAMERYGLGALITADDSKFVQATNRSQASLSRLIRTANSAGPAFGRMSRQVQQVAQSLRHGSRQISTGISQLNTGLRNAALGMLPLTVAIGAGVRQAATFEKQMSAVGSITRADEKDMAALTKEAKRMGIVSVFTATQAGEGMEFLARSGADANQIIAALQGTMNAAAADSIDLATASDIVAQVVKGMGLGWENAAHIADTLALASASSNTNITQLGESFKYGVSSARALGISLEETTAIFGKLADAGLKGSLAGTSFTNMINKLSRPSKKAQGILKKWKVTLDESDGSLRSISSIVDDVRKGMEKLPTASSRAAASIELFGLRGAKAYHALAAAGKDSLDALEDSLIASSAGVGAATEMAEKRLDNFLGKMTLFKASIESLSIGLFSPLLKTFTPTIENMTNGLNSVLFSLEALGEIRDKENQENALSAQLIAREASNRMKAAGVVDEYRRSTLGALQVLSRMQLSEENLSSTQINARKRALAAAIEAETTRRAEVIKSNQIEAAGVQAFEELGETRKSMVLKHIDAMTKSRQAEAQNMIDLAFKGAKGSAEAQKWLRQRILEEAIAGNKNLSDEQRKAIEQEISSMMELEAAASKQADNIRSQIFSIEKLQEIEDKYGTTAVQIALGIQDAVDTLRNAWAKLTDKVKEFGKYLEDKLGSDGVRKLAKYATVFAVIAAAIIPVILALVMFGFAVSGLSKAFMAFKTIGLGAISLIKGALTALLTAFWPITLVLGAIGLAFLFIREEGESVGETFTRVWNGIKNTVSDVYNNVILPFIEGFRKRWNQLVGGVIDKWRDMWNSASAKITEVVNKIKERFYAIFGTWIDGMSDMQISWDQVGGRIAEGVAYVAGLIADAVGLVVDIFVWLMDTIWSVLEGPLTAFRAAADAISEQWFQIKESFVSLWETVVAVFNEVRTAIGALVDEIVGIFTDASDFIGVDWAELGSFIGTVVGGLLTAILEVIKFIVKAIGKVISTVAHILKTVLGGIRDAFKEVFGGILQVLDGDFLGGIKRIGIGIFNALTAPIRAVLAGLLKLVRQIPYVEEGAKALGIDIAGIQKWLDEGWQSEELKAEKAEKAAAKKKKAVKVAEQGAEKMEKKSYTFEKGKLETGVSREERLMRQRKMLGEMSDLKAREKRRMAAKPKVEATVNVEDKRQLDIKNSMCVEGEAMDVATARHKQEIQDRSGFKSTPWQRRAMLEHGAAPVKGVA